MNAEDKKPRIIKKYPNRRLYDETDSSYINFSDLHKMILEGKEFKVIVDKTNEDQTLKLMLQIFLDLELSGQQLFSDESLKALILLNFLIPTAVINIGLPICDRHRSSVVKISLISFSVVKTNCAKNLSSYFWISF